MSVYQPRPGSSAARAAEITRQDEEKRLAELAAKQQKAEEMAQKMAEKRQDRIFQIFLVLLTAFVTLLIEHFETILQILLNLVS